MTKPMVFNYADHERALEEIKKLKEDIANLQIRCRIAESEKPDRDCNNCKYHKPDGCSRWDCEYEPVMSDLISRQDAILAIEDMPNAYNGWSDTYDKACIIGVLEELPSAEPPYQYSEAYVKQLRGERDILEEMVKNMAYRPTGWIPVSEKVPEEEEKTYWICTDGGYQCECRWTNVNHFWTDLTTDWHWHICDVPQYDKVVAWMPLPEPYKEDGE